MMKILQESECVTNVRYFHHFVWANDRGAGLAFECDEHGNPLDGTDNDYLRCVDGSYDVIDRGVERHDESFMTAAIGRCDGCGSEIELGAFTNTCQCGAEYNSCGQRLCDRSYWGEETGEHWTECI